jgi:hypothetical protein
MRVPATLLALATAAAVNFVRDEEGAEEEKSSG